MKGMCSLRQWARIGLAVIAAIAVLAVVAVLPGPAPRAQASELSGSAIIEYDPQSWPFAVSVGGLGQLELAEVRQRAAQSTVPERPSTVAAPMQRTAQAAAPGLVVRDGTTKIEVSRGQVLVFRVVADKGASLVSVRIGGEDALSVLRADGVLVLPAEQAQVGLDVVFSATAADTGAVSGRLAQTGDLPWIGALAFILAALCAFCATRCAARRREHG